MAALGAEPVPGDLSRPESYADALAECDTIVHAAALVEFFGHRDELYRVNVEGTRTLLSAAKAHGVRRFVLIGAAAVFSEGAAILNQREDAPLPAQPYGDYANSKAQAETLVRAAASDEFETIVLRPPLIWGPGDQSFLPSVVKAIRQRLFVWIRGGR